MSIYDRIKRDISQEYYAANYANDGQRFIAWYLRNIYGLDTEEAKSCITDGAGDKQIDAVYVSNDDETIYIIQGKFVQKGKIDSSPLREIHSAWMQIKDLKHLQENANDKLAGKISEISSALDDDYDVCFELVTTSELTKSAQKYLELYRQEFENYGTLNANLAVINAHSLETRYNATLSRSPNINHDFRIEPGRYMEVTVSGKKAVIAVISLKDCLNIPGIEDGSLFRKNVRQSLGKKVKINKEIAASLKKPGDFFFLHNGITSICSSIEIHDGIMSAKDLSVVNGCQSLTTIYNNSQTVKDSEDGYVVFRFYEITESEKSDIISTSTNTQNAVKARDLRSNDKYVLAMKKSYEQCYPDGRLITKRGEKPSGSYNPLHVVELGTLGKILISWHMQRPTDTHVESKIFSSNFDILFHREYSPENIQALNEIYRAVFDKWSPKNDNPLGFNEALFRLKSYAPYWHLFAEEKTFNPPNWPKSSKSIMALRSAVAKRLSPSSPDDRKNISGLKDKLKMSKKDFSPIWAD